MASNTSLDRIPIPAVEPVRRKPRLFVVEGPRSAQKRSATEQWLVALVLLSAVVFASAMATFVVSPAITTVTASSPASSFDGP